MRCARTGQALNDPSDGLWDDGEWISWDWINHQIYDRERQAAFPKADLELVQVFDDLVRTAAEYKALTGRYLQIWGELGELYAEIKYGIKRHATGTRGSDGRLGNDWIEVKTISPEKNNHKVEVKRAGNFNKLLIVKINADFEFEDRLLDRKSLSKGTGKLARVSWRAAAE